MLRTSLIVMVLLMVAGCACNPPASPPMETTWIKIADRLEQSVFQIHTIDVPSPDGTPQGLSCSGWLYRHTLLVGNAHCASDAQTTMFFVAGRMATIIKIDTVLDLLVLRVQGVQGRPLRLSSRDVVAGELVGVSGFPFAFREPMFFLGHVVHPSYDRSFFLQVGFYGGESGSPVVNRHAEVVSMVNASVRDFAGRNLSRGVTTKDLREFLAGVR